MGLPKSDSKKRLHAMKHRLNVKDDTAVPASG